MNKFAFCELILDGDQLCPNGTQIYDGSERRSCVMQTTDQQTFDDSEAMCKKFGDEKGKVGRLFEIHSEEDNIWFASKRSEMGGR